MMNDWEVLRQIGDAMQSAPLELASAGLCDYDYARVLECPEIRVTYPSYPNTAGPRGGIGGQVITSVPCVVLIYEMSLVFVSAGTGCYFCCRMSAEFQKLLDDGANPWTHRHHFIEKKEPRDEKAE